MPSGYTVIFVLSCSVPCYCGCPCDDTVTALGEEEAGRAWLVVKLFFSFVYACLFAHAFSIRGTRRLRSLIMANNAIRKSLHSL